MQERFTQAILKQMAGIDFPLERIFSQTVSGQPKSEVLEQLQAKHSECDNFHFVEDKLSTLQKVMMLDKLQGFNLYLVDWGYNTEDEKDLARQNDRIQLVTISQYSAMLAP